jgi:fatty acid desaturase
MPEQSYHPFRQALLKRDELRDLNRLRFRRVVGDTLFLWAQIFASWAVAANTHYTWLIILCACFAGNRYYSLYIIGHDGLHRRIHNDPKINDLWTDIFLIGPLGAVVHRNRRNHMIHHSALATDSDPDKYKYCGRQGQNKTRFYASFSAIPFLWRALRNVYLRRTDIPQSTAAINSYNMRDVAILLTVQLSLLTGLTCLFGWWGFFAMWLIPVYIFTFCADMARVFCEHSIPKRDSEGLFPDRLVTFRSNILERTFFAPMNMNHHVAHHLWPSIPYYNLPTATALLEKNLHDEAFQLTQIPSSRQLYLQYIIEYPENSKEVNQ